MSKYDYTGVVTKFGKKWRWIKHVRHHQINDHPVSIFKVEPYYEVDMTSPRPRPTDADLTRTIGVRGTIYVFPARRMPCPQCDGGIRRQLKLRPHGGVCYCDFTDGTIIDFDFDRMSDEQKEVVATYHLDQQMSSPW